MHILDSVFFYSWHSHIGNFYCINQARTRLGSCGCISLCSFPKKEQARLFAIQTDATQRCSKWCTGAVVCCVICWVGCPSLYSIRTEVFIWFEVYICGGWFFYFKKVFTLWRIGNSIGTIWMASTELIVQLCSDDCIVNYGHIWFLI